MTSPTLSHDETTLAARALTRFRELFAARKFTKEQLADPAVVDDLAHLAVVADRGAAALRFETLSVLAKAAETSKPIALVVRPTISAALRNPLPRIGAWGNADDRYYLAKALSVSDQDWIGAYAALELGLADTSEKSSREVWAELALTRCDSIAQAVRLVGEGLAAGADQVNDGQIVQLRRLSRICEALLGPLLHTELTAGADLGAAFKSLIALSSRSTTAEFAKARLAAAETAMDMVLTLLRTRFETIFDPEMYRAVSAPLRWWHPASPPEEVQVRLDRAAKLAVEALYALARQGVTDFELRRAITGSLGAERFDALASRKALSDPSLDPEISRWLSNGRALRTDNKHSAVDEILDAELDHVIARMLIDRANFGSSSSTIRQVADDIGAFEPAHGSTIKSVANYLDLLDQSIETAARKRGISISPERGLRVRFDPRIHETAHQVSTSADVTVALPGAVKTQAGRPAIMLVKAIVK